MTISSPSRPYLDGKKLNKIEQNKAAKDGLLVGSEIDKFAEMGWEQVDETDLQLRLKWYGMFWRPKTPGKFMLRLRVHFIISFGKYHLQQRIQVNIARTVHERGRPNIDRLEKNILDCIHT